MFSVDGSWVCIAFYFLGHRVTGRVYSSPPRFQTAVEKRRGHVISVQLKVILPLNSQMEQREGVGGGGGIILNK